MRLAHLGLEWQTEGGGWVAHLALERLVTGQTDGGGGGRLAQHGWNVQGRRGWGGGRLPLLVLEELTRLRQTGGGLAHLGPERLERDEAGGLPHLRPERV